MYMYIYIIYWKTYKYTLTNTYMHTTKHICLPTPCSQTGL